jgi:hypothetical protein
VPDPTNRLGFTNTVLGRDHIPGNQGVRYAFCPPTSGDHVNAQGRGPIEPRVYPPNDAKTPAGWIHNLEHGYVMALYRCPGGAVGAEGCPTADEMAQLQAYFDQAQKPTVSTCTTKVLVGRFDQMSTRFAVVAWGRSLLMDTFDLQSALTFAQQWMEHDAVPEANIC